MSYGETGFRYKRRNLFLAYRHAKHALYQEKGAGRLAIADTERTLDQFLRRLRHRLSRGDGWFESVAIGQPWVVPKRAKVARPPNAVAHARRLFPASEPEPDAGCHLQVVSDIAATREPVTRSDQARRDVTNVDAQAAPREGVDLDDTSNVERQPRLPCVAPFRRWKDQNAAPLLPPFADALRPGTGLCEDADPGSPPTDLRPEQRMELPAAPRDIVLPGRKEIAHSFKCQRLADVPGKSATDAGLGRPDPGQVQLRELSTDLEPLCRLRPRELS